jgi:hypothetical protein
MDLCEASECSEMLIDLVCYEKYVRRLSPEMERLFDVHLEHCAVCRHRADSYQEVLAQAMRHQNFG